MSRKRSRAARRGGRRNAPRNMPPGQGPSARGAAAPSDKTGATGTPGHRQTAQGASAHRAKTGGLSSGTGKPGHRQTAGSPSPRRTAFAWQPEYTVAAFAALCLALLAHGLIDLTGHDYGYFLPKMLDTHLFYLKNGFALQEYTAGICAGIFQFANPQSMAVALPQGLSYLFGPRFGIPATFVVISAFTGVGTYLCARYWGLNKMPACIAAIAIAFNGFLLTRMAIGHLAFHGFGLAPAIAAALLYGIGAMHHRSPAVYAYAGTAGEPVKQGRSPQLNGWGGAVFRLKGAAAMLAGRSTMLGALAALLIAFLIYSGIGVMIIHTAAVAFLLLLICGGFQRQWFKAVAYCLFWAAIGLLAAAPKIEAVLAMNANLPRDFYPIPGFTPASVPLALFQSVFGIPDEQAMNGYLRNGQFYMGWHEFYFGFTPLLLAALLLSVALGWKRLPFAAALRARPVVFSLVAAALLLAVALNAFEPNWNRIIKSLPLLGQFSGMTRFFIFFMPVAALFLGWTINHYRRIPALAVLLFTAAMALAQHGIIDANLRPGMHYNRIDLNGNPIRGERNKDQHALNAMLAAWAEPEQIPPVSAVAVRTERQEDGSLRAAHTPFADGIIAQGQSNALCYEPLFGYRLEQYAFPPLRPGPIAAADAEGNLNLKNPACYVYPEENACAPGDHFTTEQREQMLALAAYGDPGLAVSESRRLANKLGITTLLALLIYLLGWALLAIHRRFRL